MLSGGGIANLSHNLPEEGHDISQDVALRPGGQVMTACSLMATPCAARDVGGEGWVLWHGDFI